MSVYAPCLGMGAMLFLRSVEQSPPRRICLAGHCSEEQGATAWSSVFHSSPSRQCSLIRYLPACSDRTHRCGRAGCAWLGWQTASQASGLPACLSASLSASLFVCLPAFVPAVIPLPLPLFSTFALVANTITNEENCRRRAQVRSLKHFGSYYQ